LAGTRFALVFSMTLKRVNCLNLVQLLFVLILPLSRSEARPVEHQIDPSFEVGPSTGRSPANVNEYMTKTNSKLEIQKSKTELFNQYAPSVREGAQFQDRERSITHGVDMMATPPLPDFDYDPSYNPPSLDAKIEAEVQDHQTTDYVVERKWQDIRRKINSQPVGR